MTAIVSLDVTQWTPVVSPAEQRTAVETLEGGGVLVLPHLAVRAPRRRAAIPVCALVRWPRQEHQLRRPDAQGRARKRRGPRGADGDGRAFRDERGRSRRGAVSALRRPRAQRAHQFPAAARRRTSRVVAQGRFAAAHRRFSVATQSRRAHPARVLQRQSGRRPRVARRRGFRGDGAKSSARCAPAAARISRR